MKIKQLGITLLELMVVIAIIAIIAALAYPSFTDSLRKSRRVDAVKGLLSMQLKQEEHRISNTSYSNAVADMGNPTSSYYAFAISGASATAYTLIATTQGAQVGDQAGSTACDTLTLSNADLKTPAECWK
ncbi:MAG: type IV pilin protein [Aeromonas sp.]